MSAVAIVEGVSEGLVLLNQLLSAASTVSTAISTAQSTGTPLDLSPTGALLSGVTAAENAVLAAIAAAKAAGR